MCSIELGFITGECAVFDKCNWALVGHSAHDMMDFENNSFQLAKRVEWCWRWWCRKITSENKLYAAVCRFFFFLFWSNKFLQLFYISPKIIFDFNNSLISQYCGSIRLCISLNFVLWIMCKVQKAQTNYSQYLYIFHFVDKSHLTAVKKLLCICTNHGNNKLVFAI